MKLPTYFDEFLAKISPTKDQKKIMTGEHKLLRERLMNDEDLEDVLLSTFIQGSNRRYTANKGCVDHPCDVDVVAVTNIPRGPETAAHAHQVFRPFLERHYKGRYEPQDRSWCITVHPEVKIDLVPTSEPDSQELRAAIFSDAGLSRWDPESSFLAGSALSSERDAMFAAAKRDQDWQKSEPLWIPDRKLRTWDKTHPLYLIGWSAAKNLACDGHYVGVVKALKWWRRDVEPLPKYPKGYPLEHLIGECCPDGITSVAEGVTATLAEMARRYLAYAEALQVPFLPARGVRDPEVNVMARVTGEDFAAFHKKVVRSAGLAQRALEAEDIAESATLWQQLLGREFPEPPEDHARVKVGYTPPAAPARPREGRFA